MIELGSKSSAIQSPHVSRTRDLDKFCKYTRAQQILCKHATIALYALLFL